MPSDLSVLKKWFKSLNGADFLALPAPTRERYTRGEGLEDVTEELAQRELPDDTPSVFWHWQSHKRAFTGKGELIDELLLHWRGSHAAIADRLTAPPEPFAVVDGGLGQAFRVTKPFALPEPDAKRAVRPTIKRLSVAVATGRDLDAAERDWLDAVARGGGDDASDALDLLCDVGAAPLDLLGDPLPDGKLGDFAVSLDRVWTQFAVRSPRQRLELARANPGNPLAAVLLAEPAEFDTDADDAIERTAAALLRAEDTADVVAAVAPWAAREHKDHNVVTALLTLRLRGGVCREVGAARMLDVAADERLPFYWRAQALRMARVYGVEDHLPDRYDQVFAGLGVAPGPVTGVAGPVAGDRARLRAVVTSHAPLNVEPTVLRTDPLRTKELAAGERHAPKWFWTWPDELAAFDADGRLTQPLPVHLLAATPEEIREQLPPRFEFHEEPPAIHAGACPPLEDIVAGLGDPDPADPEDLEYVQATFVRYSVQQSHDLHRDRASTLFDVWRTHGGRARRGESVELLDTRAVRALVDEYYDPGGLVERLDRGNAFPFLPFARDLASGANGLVHHLDMSERIPLVLAAEPGALPSGDPVATSVDAFLGARFAVEQE